jgi:hypothetical protein
MAGVALVSVFAVAALAGSGLPVGFVREVQQVEPSAGLEHDVLGPDGGRVDVDIGEPGDLAERPVVEVMHLEVLALAGVAVGQEIEFSARATWGTRRRRRGR